MLVHSEEDFGTTTKVLIVLAVVCILCALAIMSSVDEVMWAIAFAMGATVFGSIAMLRIETRNIDHVKFPRR